MATAITIQPKLLLREELLKASKQLDAWAYDDTTARECRQYKKAAELAHQAALMIPVDE